MSLVALMLLSSILPGCLETVSDVIEDESTHPNAAPIEAMGMWWPTIDGYIEIPTISPLTEWYDSDMIDIKFTDETEVEHPATLRYKSVDEGMALTVDIGDVEETPQQIVVTFPDRTITTEITAESDAFVPMFEIDCFILDFDCSADESKKIIDKDDSMSVELLEYMVLNKIASVHDLDDNNLVMEASAKRLFDDTTEITYTIDIVFEESTWTFTKVTDFDWVLPFLYPRSDISVTGIEVTQAIQTADMKMRLVEGKTSLARVYVDSGDLETANVEVTLNFCILLFCFDEMTKTHVAVQSPDRTDFTHSANFVLPDHWVTHEGIDGPIPIGLIAKITPIYPTGTIDYVDPDKSNNHDIGVFWFNHTRDLTVWTVLIPQDTNGDGISEFRPQGTVDQWMNYTEAMLPTANLNQVDLNWGAMPDMAGCTTQQCNGQLWNFTQQVTIGILFAILIGGDASELPPFPDQVHGITPRFGMGGGVSSPAWCTVSQCSGFSGEYGVGNIGKTSSLVGVCGDTGPNTAGNVGQSCIPHEITHNLGPYCMDNSAPLDSDCTDTTDESWGAHLAQCGAGGSDAVWATNFQPYNIKDIGWDPLATNPETNQQALVPSNYPDYMTYCGAGNTTLNNLAGGSDGFTVPYVISNDLIQWTSTLRWEWMYDKFENWSPGNPASPYNGRSSQANSTYRIISGNIPADGSVASLGHSWTDSGVVSEFREGNTNNLPAHNYTIRALDSSDSLIQEINFDPVHIDVEGEVKDHHISYVIQDNGLVNSIELFHNGNLIDSLFSTSPPATRMLPLGTNNYTRDSPVNLSWTQATTTSNRETLYQLGYSWGADIWFPIGGMTSSTNTVFDFSTIPASLQGADSKFRVRATNGFDTYYSESTSFNLPNQAPKLMLETSGWDILENLDENPAAVVVMGNSISIKPTITDADWTSINENSCSATLKQNGEIVWADGLQVDTGIILRDEKNRITTWPTSLEHGPGLHDSVHCLHNNGAFLPYSFPNKDILPGEMTPGNYVFEMTYVDVGGASVTEMVSFSIIVPNFLVGHDSTSSADEVLQEYRSKFKMMSNISKMLNDNLSRDELQYYVELERAARGDENMLSDAEMSELQEFYGISDLRDAEFIDTINQTSGDSTTSAPEKS